MDQSDQKDGNGFGALAISGSISDKAGVTTLMPSDLETPPVLETSEWKHLASSHRVEVEKVTIPMRRRRSRREKHPVYDFLNTYYSFSLGRLEGWHPGVGVVLEDDPKHEFSPKYYRRENGLVSICLLYTSPSPRD